MCLVQGTAPGNQPEGNVPEPVGEEETKGEGQEGKGEEQGQLHIAQTVPDLVLQGAVECGARSPCHTAIMLTEHTVRVWWTVCVRVCACMAPQVPACNTCKSNTCN